ncbi:MAG: hypothetical protein E7773_00750 [Sphingomonas sp.]|uniref:hypothetical protein n=1 Tax=Sphingomonas sp. TaxID=28214 RepID=UPI0012141CAE|nr:hypothetical protein [Sphingomonas sp.]THD38315.1 MAG: hypothetical protein E7773_00750 [Sphingomonas sp.]
MPGQFSVAINIGANILPSMAAAVSKVDRAFAGMSRRMKITTAESKVAAREMAAAMKPLLGLAAAGGLSASFKGILGEGAEWQHQVTMMRLAGRTSKEMSAAIAAANRTIAEVPTATLNDSLKILNETTLAFGGLGHAIANLPFNARMGALMKNLLGDDYNTGEGFNQLVRALELRSGKMSPADYQRQAGGLFRAMEVSGGTVNPENFLGFMQQAGLAARGFSESFLTRVVPSLIQEMGGERAGTAATALFNQFMGRVAVGGKSVTAEWTRLGLVPPKGTGGNLSATGWSPGTLKNNALAMSNPLEWVEGTLFPALRVHGIDTNDKNAMLLQAQKMFGRETGKRLASTLFDPAQLARIHADMSLYDKAMGPDKAYAEAMRTDPRMALAATASSLKNLETTLGKSVFTPSTIAAIQSVAKAINMLAGVFDAHPAFAKGVAGLLGFGAVAAVLRVFGVALTWLTSPLANFGKWIAIAWRWLAPMRIALVMLAELGFDTLLAAAAPVVAVLAAVGVAIAWIVAKWDGIKAFFVGIGQGFMQGIQPYLPAMRRIIDTLRSALAPLFNVLTNLWQHGIKPVFEWFGRLFAPADVANWNSAGRSIGGVIAWLAGTFVTLIDKITQAGHSLADFFSKNAPGWMNTPITDMLPKWAGGTNIGPIDGRGKPLAGKRAAGGPVWPGGTFLVGEHGPELFTPGRSGTIIPHSELQRRRAVRDGGVSVRDIHIHGANDPASTQRIVRAELARLAAGNAALLSD